MQKDAIALLHENESFMVEQLLEFCGINSGTDNLDGLKNIHQRLSHAFKPIADDIQILQARTITMLDMAGNTIIQSCGDSLYIRKRPELKRRVLLSGHMDTVYGAHHPFQKLTYINKNQINGPGVADMKGGLIVMLHALTAFEKTAAASKLGWDVFINADEEIGSPASSHLFRDIATRCQTALVYEPAMNATGTLAKNRKGSGKLTLVATGRAAHAGRAFDEGRNAICYLAKIITQIDALNGKKEGVTINVGIIAGGHALNVVPDKAVVKLDIRITQAQDEHWVRQELETIRRNTEEKDYHLTIHGGFERPVKKINKPTEDLFDRIQKLGHTLGIKLDWQDSGGCCDGNNFNAQGLPVLDTLGVRGGDIHSENEFILLDSLVERASLSTLLLHDLAQGGLEKLGQS